MSDITIRSALVSVYHKEGLEPIIKTLDSLGITLYSTGGTHSFIENLGIKVTTVESITGYPSILGGRVKTLHPRIFGGILHRRNQPNDLSELVEHDIPHIDLIIVDLYPFEETLSSGAGEDEIIEKIDIGGIALIRAGAKNYKNVLIVSHRSEYDELLHLLDSGKGVVSLTDRKLFATRAFSTSSHYDTAIFKYFNESSNLQVFKSSISSHKKLRYGENPHQSGTFYGNIDQVLEQLHGKEISYNNLVDIEAAISLISEFEGEIAFAILKHTNACGMATGNSVLDAYQKAYSADPVSAFGGILITNDEISEEATQEIDKLFFEVLVARNFENGSLETLKRKKNRILLIQKKDITVSSQFRSMLNGVLEQDRDLASERVEDLKIVTKSTPSKSELRAMIFANKIVKHTKSNAIVITNESQLMASGTGQTSRVDAVKQALEKAEHFEFDLSEGVMASDAFFPFPDSVELGSRKGIKTVIQPGGSKRDQEVIDFCNENGIVMAFTGHRHFKH